MPCVSKFCTSACCACAALPGQRFQRELDAIADTHIGGQALQRERGFAVAVAECHERLQDVSLRVACTLVAGRGRRPLALSSSNRRSAVSCRCPHLDEALHSLAARRPVITSSRSGRQERGAMPWPHARDLPSSRKVARSCWVRKPNSTCASSRTTKCRAAASPASRVRAGCRSAKRHIDFVAEPFTSTSSCGGFFSASRPESRPIIDGNSPSRCASSAARRASAR